MTKNKSNDTRKTVEEPKWGVGVGLTATAVAAVGAYFLYGSENAERNRKTVKSWMLKAKAEVLERLEQTQQITKQEYDSLVNSIGTTYADVQRISKKDINDFKKEMKGHWQTLEQYAKELPKKAQSVTQKAKRKAKTKKPSTHITTKKTVQKTAKKTTRTTKKAQTPQKTKTVVSKRTSAKRPKKKSSTKNG